jgi:hypothetical protein
VRNLEVLISDLSNDVDGVCEAQAVGGARSLNLNGALVSGGVAVFGQAQPVRITAAGDATGAVFTVSGTDANGQAVSEAVTGPNTSTADTTTYFKSVTSITSSAAATGNITVGVVAALGAVSKALRVNREAKEFKLGLFAHVISGTLTYTVEFAFDAPEAGYANGYQSSATWRGTSGLTNLTSNAESNIAYPVNAVRLRVTSYTSGSIRLVATQGSA